MTIDTLTIRLLFLFIPGIITFGMIDALGPERDRGKLVALFQIFLYGIASYTAIGIAANDVPMVFTKELYDTNKLLDLLDLVWASSAGVLIGIFVTLNLNYSLLRRLFQYVKITKRFGDVDVWAYTFNSSSIKPWATVLDHNRSLIYDGYVKAFSGGERYRELLLVKVKIYDLRTAEPIEEDIEAVYLSFDPNDVSVEFRAPLS